MKPRETEEKNHGFFKQFLIFPRKLEIEPNDQLFPMSSGCKSNSNKINPPTILFV